jgi:mono/diheme cytochrome c family protein
MVRVALRLAGVLAGIAVAAAVLLGMIAARRLDHRYHVPTPAITRATSPDEVARGARLYRTACATCHTQPGAAHSCGAAIPNFPTTFGTIVSSNLTRDPARGIGARSDGELARLLRHGVMPDGRYSRTMPRARLLGDQDIAALLGFLRSDDPLFTPCGEETPAAHLSLLGRIALALFGPKPPAGDGDFDPAPVPVPPRAPSAAYGRYLATAIYGCVGCHTDGLDDVETKLASPNLLAGGLELPDPRGDRVLSTNLTPDPTGIRQWTLAQFDSALTTGIAPGGGAIRSPMPILRFTDAVETEAIYRYLQSVPPVNRTPPARPAPPPLSPGAPPEEVFLALGCAPCHGQGAPFRNVLRGLADRPADAVAEAIRHPERAHPATQMPTFAEVLDPSRAAALAQWLQKPQGQVMR